MQDTGSSLGSHLMAQLHSPHRRLRQRRRGPIYICTRVPAPSSRQLQERAASTASAPRFVQGGRFGMSSLLRRHAAARRSPGLYDAEDHGKVLLVGHLDPAVLVRVVASEDVRQPLGENHRRSTGETARAP